MNKLKKFLNISILLIFIIISLSFQIVLASDNEKGKELEYTEEYKRWLNLTDEEKSKVLQPRKYEVLPTNINIQNPILKARMLGASMSSKYSLKDTIPENLTIRNQGKTSECWAFAAISSLETNLALSDHNNGISIPKIYDYSERHMDYANSKVFANGEKNPIGYNRNVGLGNWGMAESYLTNGTGAINEIDMPFEDNEEKIDIREIQNKTVSSQVYDTVDFPDYSNQTAEVKLTIMNKIKQHIKDHGSVYSQIHGDTPSISGLDCYNNDTGAKYCNNPLLHAANHAVSIIGWDDNYSIDNFAEGARPSSKGAWIVRNSWGEREEFNLADVKNKLFENNKEYCIEKGWNTAEEIDNDYLEQVTGYNIEGDVIYYKIGDNGIMYVSYEDCNISKSLHGIEKATDTVDYENIYQYDEYHAYYGVEFNSNNIIICNTFDKKTTGKEYITQVSLYAGETYNCRVYVNPNGTSKEKKDMKLIQLKAGESETLNAGYHTLEFAKPIEIKGDSFAIAIEIEGTRANIIELKVEANPNNDEILEPVKLEKNKCFITLTKELEGCTWYDLGNAKSLRLMPADADTTIKAFTVSEVNLEDLGDEEIQKEPRNSNLDNITCNVNKIKCYTYSDSSKQDYMVIDMTVEGISKNTQNDSCEYYYYLSSNPDETNIENWVKITKESKDNEKIQFEINTTDVKNYKDLLSSNNLYLYIKEVAKKGEKQSEIISRSIKLNSDIKIEVYSNGAKINNSNSANSENGVIKESNSNIKDQTTAIKTLPNTGITSLVIVIVIISIIGGIGYIRYKSLKKYIK